MPTQPAILGTMRLGNFRLGYVPAALATLRQTTLTILLGGLPARVRVHPLTIRDILNEAPNTCSLTIDDENPPTDSQALRITIGASPRRLLFAGTLQATNLTYQGLPDQRVWPATAIDHTARLNRRRPFGTWVNVSATTIAQYLVAVFAPGFTATHIAAGLPAVSIIFDGTDTFMGCMVRLATASGGYTKVEDLDVYLFQTDTDDAPDPIDDTPGRFLDTPHISVRRDVSQLRTRVCGKGHGEAVPSAVLALDTMIPLPDVALFNPLGGKAIAGTTSDGAQSQLLNYTGVQLGGGGSLVGPGAAPSTAPTLDLTSGSGLGTGVYKYAYTDKTAAGESLPSPLGTITTGVAAAPASAPTPSLATVGSGPDTGSHEYEATFVTSTGETTPGPVSGSVTTGPVTGSPISQPTIPTWSGALWAPGVLPNGTFPANQWGWAVTFVNAWGETTAGPRFTWLNSGGTPNTYFTGIVLGIPTGPAGVTARRIYRTVAQPDTTGALTATMYLETTVADNTTTTVNVGIGDGTVILGTSPPSTNTTGAVTNVNQIPITGIPIGPAIVTARKLYRRFNGAGSFLLVATIPNNTATTYTDTTVNASLGAAAPSSNTATANQVTVSGIAIGAAGTTDRYLYRTAVNGSQLKLLNGLGNNTGTTYVDTGSDAVLGVNAPVADTSGLVQPAGQVNAGSTSILMASPATFLAGGGWVFLAGDQTVRYTGITGNTLTGIPATGPGALLTTVLYGSQAVPAPALTGVAGLTLAMARGTPVHIWVQRDDLAAQATQAALDTANGITPADGIYEGPPIVDERRGEASLIALCDVNLQMFSTPIVTVTFASRDVRMKSGKTIVFDLTTPPIHETLVIQEVTIDQIGVASGTLPRFLVTASSVRFSLEDLLRKLAAA